MLRTCDECHKRYDDALCFTFCPHGQFISEEDAARKDEAFSLIGKKLYFAGKPEGPEVTVEAVTHDGMLEISGFTGQFAPHLFVVRICSWCGKP